MKAVIYARYSSEMQRAASIEDQARNCRKRADAEGWEVIATFADAAMSGSDASRPQYLAMLEAAGRHEFDVLLVDDLSRLTRDSVEQERAIRRLEFQGLLIVGCSDGYDSTSKARKLHRGVKGLMNEMYLDDLRERTHRGIEGQARKGFWIGGRPYGYRLKAITDPTKRDQYGQPARIGSKLEIDPEQAAVVRDIYERFADGRSHRQIAVELNRLNVPSPGSTWNRKTRRCSGWLGSSVRVILQTPFYGGLVRWNAHAYVKDPDTGKHKRRARPRSEWFEYRDESLRIIPDELLERVRARTKTRSTSDGRLRNGGKAKFLLTGLLHCACCRGNFTMVNAKSYGCGGSRSGACLNDILVRRDKLEASILDPIRKELLSPERVAKMAAEMQAMYAQYIRDAAGRAEERPRQLAELDARIDRLRERQRAGDPDLTADELQTAIDRALQKRRELERAQPEARESAAVLATIPKAAAMYRQQIELGLDGDPRAASKARVILRQLFNEEIVLRPGPDRSLWAEYEIRPGALIRVGTDGGPCRT